MHYKSKNTFLLHLFIVCICMCLGSTPGYPCGVGRTAYQSLFSQSIVWDPGIELTLSGLVISTFTGLVFLPVYEYTTFIMKNKNKTKQNTNQHALRQSRIEHVWVIVIADHASIRLSSDCSVTVHAIAEKWVLFLWHPPVENIFKHIYRSAKFLLHLPKDKKGPIRP